MRKIVLLLAALLWAVPAHAQIGLTQGSVPSLQSGLTTTVETVKASQGTLDWVTCWNPDATVEYVQVFDTTGTVTLGTTAPKLWIPVAPTSVLAMSYASAVGPVPFLHAIQVAATTTPTGSSAPSTALQCVFGFN